MIDKDTIIRLARRTWGESAILPFDELERFAQAIYRQGLEDAAKIVEQKDMDYYGIVPAIRALGEQHE